MTGLKLKIMLEGLISTAVEKVNVLGWEDAKGDVRRICELVEDLEMFWDEDGKLTKRDWVYELLEAVENAGGVIHEL